MCPAESTGLFKIEERGQMLGRTFISQAIVYNKFFISSKVHNDLSFPSSHSNKKEVFLLRAASVGESVSW
jgi:hypothetical protein